MRNLAPTAAEELLEIVMACHESASILLTSTALYRTPQRQRRRYRHARLTATQPSHPEMRATKLADETGLA